MKSGLVIIQIRQDGIYFNDLYFIPLTQSNFPTTGYSFRKNKSNFWLANMTNFKNGQLYLTIEEFNSNQVRIFEAQHPKKAIRKVVFAKMSWELLKGQMTFYKKSLFAHLIRENASTGQQHPIEKFSKSNYKSQSRIIPFDTEVFWTKLEWKMGEVCAKIEIEQVGLTKKASTFMACIKNHHILPAYQYLVPYLKKSIGAKKVHIKGQAELLDGKIMRIMAHSKEIDAINESKIGVMRQMHLDHFAKKTNIDKTLFTAEDIFHAEVHESDVSHPLQVSDNDLILEMLEKEDIRNAAQIKYLCLEIQKKEKIRFTLTPKIGFVFYHKSTTHHQFIWELLDSNATYIWQFYREAISKNKALEHMTFYISSIKNEGRANFRNNWLSLQLHPSDGFHMIHHQYANHPLIDEFPLWRARLAEIIDGE